MAKLNVMTNLEIRIKELQIEIDNCGCQYKTKRLKSDLGFLKAELKGQFITKEDLVEYKGLIIFLLKKANYRGYMNLKQSMTTILEKIENENNVFKTKRGIKGILSRMALTIGLDNSETNLREANGICVTANSYGNEILSNFVQFKLNTLI